MCSRPTIVYLTPPLQSGAAQPAIYSGYLFGLISATVGIVRARYACVSSTDQHASLSDNLATELLNALTCTSACIKIVLRSQVGQDYDLCEQAACHQKHTTLYITTKRVNSGMLLTSVAASSTSTGVNSATMDNSSKAPDTTAASQIPYTDVSTGGASTPAATAASGHSGSVMSSVVFTPQALAKVQRLLHA